MKSYSQNHSRCERSHQSSCCQAFIKGHNGIISHLFQIKKQKFIILFIVDDVYMEDEEWRKEYVLRQHGAIYVGNSRYQNGRDWYFGQVWWFEIAIFFQFSLTKLTIIRNIQRKWIRAFGNKLHTTRTHFKHYFPEENNRKRKKTKYYHLNSGRI